MPQEYRQPQACLTCGNYPSSRADRFGCDCPDKLWYSTRSVEADEATLALLSLYGFRREQDVRKNVYYIGPDGGPIIELFADGTWSIFGWKPPSQPEQTELADYLEADKLLREQLGKR